MAISILSTTWQSAPVHSGFQTINIPATTAGSTLILLLSFQNFSGAFGNNQISFVYDEDWDGMSIFSSGWLYTADTGMSNSRRCQIAYRSNVPAGLTQVNVSMLDVCQSMYMTVIEAAGVNIITPLDQQGTHVATVTNTNAVGPSLTTAKTNALFVSTGISSQFTQGSPNSGGGNSPWIKTSSPFFVPGFPLSGNVASDRVQAYMIAGPGTFNSTMNRTANNTQTYSMSSASFNPDPNSFTLNLSETITVSDSLDDQADYNRSLTDSMSLSDVLNIVNFSNNQFKSLGDSMTLAEVFTTVYSGNRFFSEAIFVTDTIAFQSNFDRVFSDNIKLTEWMSIKKTNSTRWGD